MKFIDTVESATGEILITKQKQVSRIKNRLIIKDRSNIISELLDKLSNTFATDEYDIDIREHFMFIRFSDMTIKLYNELNRMFVNADCFKTYNTCILDLREQ